MSANIVGVDIGSASIRAVELKNADKNKLSIVRFHEMPLPEGSVRRGEVLEKQTVATALKRLWSTGGFKTKDVVLGIGGPRVVSRDLALPRVPAAQVKEILPFHVQEMLPVPVEEALLDFYPTGELSTENGPMVTGLLIAAIKEAVSANIAAVTEAGLRPVHVDLIPFALVRALGEVREKPGVTAMVSIGANTTNVVITQDGVPHFVRIIPSGSDDTTQAIANRLQLEPSIAESLKRDFGLTVANMSPEHRPIAEVIYESVGELLTGVRNTITFYANSKPDLVVDRIVLSGGGSRMPGLLEALAQLTSLPVVQADPFGGIELPKQFTNVPREQQDAMTTAFGLARGTVA
ncbi:MAG: pilus assembly protein PilM [Schumannella sp.]|nr:pilus assembly protein PilM [Schumannella sp.]